MNREITQQVMEEMQELRVKSIKKGIEEKNIVDLNIFFRKGKFNRRLYKDKQCKSVYLFDRYM